MSNRIAIILSACLLALTFAVISKTQTPSGPKHKVVFHLNESEGPTWDAVIGHVTNLRKAFEKDGGAQVEVVFNGDGVNMLRKTNTASEEGLKRLFGEGVVLAACQNSMRGRNLKPEDLFPFATPVDSGVAELTRKQEAGFAYIH